ncbi:MAG TPA: hypothetical protein VH023_07285 [Rhodopila sp.]|nr:hypothetical protein [Rhodopila sp.]
MITDIEACHAVADSYGSVPSVAIGDVRLVITRKPWGSIVAIPGTREAVLADWVRDLWAFPHESRQHPELGECHDGCLAGAEMALAPTMAAVGNDPYVVAAHSLGGGVGVLLAAMMTRAGRAPVRITTFGCMRHSIGPDVPGILAAVPGVSYRNGGDPVPGLPPWPYADWRVAAQLGARGGDSIPDHFIAAYQAAMGE